MDSEIKGEGNSYTTEFRMLDPRIGRWLSIDPKVTAFDSPYSSMGNNPILRNDIKGDTAYLYNLSTGAYLGKINSTDVNEHIKIAGWMLNSYPGIADIRSHSGDVYENGTLVDGAGFIAGMKTYSNAYEEQRDENVIAYSTDTYKMTFEGEIVGANDMTGKTLNPDKNAEYGITGTARLEEVFDDGSTLSVLESPFTSGPYANGPTPNHNYTATNWVSSAESGMQNNAGADGWKVYIEDFNGRSGLRIHPDCNSIGTAGCIGLRTTDLNLAKWATVFNRELVGEGKTISVEFQIEGNPNYGNDGNANPNIGQ